MTILSPLPQEQVWPSKIVGQLINGCNAAMLVSLGWAAAAGFSAMAMPVAGVYLGFAWAARAVRGLGSVIMKPPAMDPDYKPIYSHPRLRILNHVSQFFVPGYRPNLRVCMNEARSEAGIDYNGVIISNSVMNRIDDSQFAAFIGHELTHIRMGLRDTQKLREQAGMVRGLPVHGCAVAAAFLAVGAPLPAVAFAALAPLAVAPVLARAVYSQLHRVEHICDEGGAAASGSSYQMIRLLHFLDRQNAATYAGFSTLQKIWCRVATPLPLFTEHPSIARRQQHMHKLRDRYRSHQPQMALYQANEQAYQQARASWETKVGQRLTSPSCQPPGFP